MRVLALTVLTMLAFAGNSVLNRLALTGGDIDPASFALIRTVAGAVTLCLLVMVKSGGASLRQKPDVWAVLALLTYMVGFSFAYVTLDAGIGALILFGGVQVTMFAGALWRKETIPLGRWLGACLAFGGLVYLLWPGNAQTPPLLGAALMIPAAIGWGIYSLRGQSARDPLATTARNFAYAAPLTLVPLFLTGPLLVQSSGVMLAIASGAITSGLGYALWYAVLPRLDASMAAISQLTVPLIAMAGGMVFLGEAASTRFFIAAALVCAGVVLSLKPTRR